MREDRIALGVGGAALLLLLGALGFQYLGGIAPCEMCHWQRWGDIAAIIFALAALSGRQTRAFAFLAVAAIAVSGLIGAYQTGMQWHILPGPTACTAARYVLGGGAPAPEIPCDVATFTLFGLSLAAYNAIISLAVAALALFGLARKP
ncbi:MAG TPA: disulfide bond formation protein B [Rhizomicrobium sp.]